MYKNILLILIVFKIINGTRKLIIGTIIKIYKNGNTAFMSVFEFEFGINKVLP